MVGGVVVVAGGFPKVYDRQTSAIWSFMMVLASPESGRKQGFSSEKAVSTPSSVHGVSQTSAEGSSSHVF